ncbi:MAG: glutamate synthase subunit beta [Puniceicoccales bacterium]|jgi:glutamate synthase (NADPH/NADH) small chain|nr:glutamate synthase subunit beta [Puniceicoccales bacterium]
MGELNGYLKYFRESGEDTAPLERLDNWKEFHGHLDEARLRRQAARCMNCGTPFCHAGRANAHTANMATGCPLHNLIPDFNDFVCNGHWEQAYRLLSRTSCFPEFTSRVCPAPCETAGCNLNDISTPPVTIKDIEYAIIEKAWEEGWVESGAHPAPTGKRVAVIGSGPAGLAAAMQLNSAGHKVTVYERSDRPGGLLMYGIPNMKIDKGVILKRVGLLKKNGVEFVCGADVGGALDIRELDAREKFDAIILATGSTLPRDLQVEGRELKGIHFAVDYLTEATKSLLDNRAPRITASGKQVVVIGGGDTGNDCTGASLRQNNPDNDATQRHTDATLKTVLREQSQNGAALVTQLEIMPKPDRTRDPHGAANPWPQWPKVLKTDYGQHEAIEVQKEFARKHGRKMEDEAADPRRWLTTVKRFTGDADGNVTGVVTVKVAWGRNEKGVFGPIESPGTEEHIPAQLVLLAMGFTGPQQKLLKDLGVEIDPRGNARAAHEDHRTSNPKVFAAGDCRRGQSLVVWAMNEGRAAARECDRFLMGETTLP